MSRELGGESADGLRAHNSEVVTAGGGADLIHRMNYTQRLNTGGEIAPAGVEFVKVGIKTN